MLALGEKLIEYDRNPYSYRLQILTRPIENAAFQRRRFLNNTIYYVFNL